MRIRNLSFNSPEMKEAIQYYAELAQIQSLPDPRHGGHVIIISRARWPCSSTQPTSWMTLPSRRLRKDHLPLTISVTLAGTSFDPHLVDNTRVASIINHKSSAGYGTVVALGFFKQSDAAKTAAAQKFVEYLYTPNAYVTFLHMAPGGMNPMLKEIATNPRFQNDPQGIFSRYGADKMAEIHQWS